MALPFVLYVATVWRYSANVPYWDDFSVILRPVATVFAAGDWREDLRLLAMPNAGHLPLLTRLVAVLQVWWGGAVDFRQSILLANAGWLLAVILLLAHARRQWQLSWPALLPVPLLMLSVTHWESMDFTTPAWQMYWGSTFLPLACLLAAVRGRWLLAALCHAVALFLSSGALALLPLVTAYGLYRRQWQGVMLFALVAGAVTGGFLWMNPPQAQQVVLPSPAVVVHFIPAFMGNVVGTGTWYLESLAGLHGVLGLLVIVAGLRVLQRARATAVNDSAALVFLYVMVLAVMAVYLRGGSHPFVVSRYSPFALLAVACLYCALAAEWRMQGIRVQRITLALAITVSAGLWLYSYASCTRVLAYNHTMRLDIARYYARHGELDRKLLWDPAYGETVLREAAAAGVFDPAVWEH